MPRVPLLARPWLRRRSGPAALAVLAAVPVLGWAAGLTSLTGLTLSPASVSSGSSATGTVTIDNPVLKGSVTVGLTSSSTGVATVPSSVTFNSLLRSTSVSFPVRSVSGASGCSRITARLGTSETRQATFFVLPAAVSSPLKLRFSSAGAVGGQSLTGTVEFYRAGTSVTAGTVQLSSGAPTVASVPASAPLTVTVREGQGEVGVATFPVTTSVSDVPTCAVITATFGGATTKALLKVFPIGG